MMSLVIDADGHVEENLAELVGAIPAAMQPRGTPMNRDAARNYGDFFNTHQFTGLFESMARRELRRDPTILD